MEPDPSSETTQEFPQDLMEHEGLLPHSQVSSTSLPSSVFNFHFSFPSFVRLIDVFLKHF
jgi:hypothetical protein